MESIVIVFLVAVFASALTLFSGFGLATILMPVFLWFFPVQVAIASTAVVHWMNNLFKIGVVGKFAIKRIVLKFGIPAVTAAMAGAWALSELSAIPALETYEALGREAVITPLKLIMAALIFAFALFELLPRLRHMKFAEKHLFLGGLLSGFFGGLSGHQGALRSAFLVKTGIKTKNFVGTNAVIAFMVDFFRILVYGLALFPAFLAGELAESQLELILAGIGGAFFGVMFGRRFIGKVTIHAVQTLVGVFLILVAVLLGLGII